VAKKKRCVAKVRRECRTAVAQKGNRPNKKKGRRARLGEDLGVSKGGAFLEGKENSGFTAGKKKAGPPKTTVAFKLRKKKKKKKKRKKLGLTKKRFYLLITTLGKETTTTEGKEDHFGDRRKGDAGAIPRLRCRLQKGSDGGGGACADLKPESRDLVHDIQKRRPQRTILPRRKKISGAGRPRRLGNRRRREKKGPAFRGGRDEPLEERHVWMGTRLSKWLHVRQEFFSTERGNRRGGTNPRRVSHEGLSRQKRP